MGHEKGSTAEGFEVIGLQVGLLAAMVSQAATEPALTVRLERPGEQMRRVIALFDGTSSPHPAAALAQWKRARGGEESLGKSTEALIAAFNPGMAEELRAFDGAELQMSFAAPPLRWNATVPADTSHVFAAFATAMALTDGGPEPPLGRFQVDRLGPKPGGILMAHDGSRVILGAGLDDLRRGQERLEERPERDGSSRFRASLLPERFGSTSSPNVQRLVQAVQGLALERMDVSAGLEGETFSVESTARSSQPFPDDAGIDPSWLDLPSADRAIAVGALRFDHSEAGLNRLFGVIDRIEKSDPAKAGAAPVRVRLNLLALGVGIRPERDLWPKLAGISACVVEDEEGAVAGAVAALHAVDEPSAERLASDLLPKLARAAGLKGEGLGTVAGRSLVIRREGASAFVTWGTVGGAPKQAWRIPDDRPSRYVLIRPSRVPGLVPAGSPLAEGLAALPAIVWEGRQRDGLATDVVRIAGLRGAVRAFLEKLPRAPAPAELRDTARPAAR